MPSRPRNTLTDEITRARLAGPPSRSLLRLLGIAAAGLAGAPTFAPAVAAADTAATGAGSTTTTESSSTAPATSTDTTSTPAVQTPPPAGATGPTGPTTAAPAAAQSPTTAPAPATAPTIGSRPSPARTPTHVAAPTVSAQRAQPGSGAAARRHSTATHKAPGKPAKPRRARKAPALHPPTTPPPAAVPTPTPVVAPSLLAPGVAPSPEAAALLGQQAPPAAVNATLGFFRIPVFLLPVYQAAGDQYGVPWQVLAAINEVETDYGYDQSVSSAGAEGWMQFMPETWKLFGADATGSGYADPYNPADAIFAAARYLGAAGAGKDLRGAIYAYNHSTAYVDSVLLRAKLIEVYPQAMIDSLTNLSIGVPPVQGTDTGQPTTQPAAPAPSKAPSAPAPGATRPPQASLTAIDPSLRAALNASLSKATGSPPPTSGTLVPALAPSSPAVAIPPSPAAPVRSAAPASASSAGGGAVDLHTRAGSNVVAAKAGRVLRAGTSSRLGGYVTLQDADGDVFTYGHLGRVGTPAGRPAPSATTSPASPPTAEAAALKLVPGATPLQVRAATRAQLPAPAPASDAPATAPPTWRAAGAPAPAVSGALRMLGYAQMSSQPPAQTIPAHPLPRLTPRASHGWLPLRAGQTLWAGSVLGQAPASGVVRFSVRPAGVSHPVDPRPLLAAWHLRREVLDPASIAPAPSATAASAGGTSTVAGGAATAAPASSAGAPATAKAAVSHRTPVAPLRYDLSTWGQDRIFFLSQARLEREVLADRRVHIYACGRRDIARHSVNGRVLAVLEYLADSGLHPTVSELRCRPGTNASSKGPQRASGDAVDISAINGTPVAGHQGPGSVTDFTIRRLLSLQGAFVPQEIDSLMAYPQGGNTVSMPSHADDIRVAYGAPGAARAASPTARAATAPSPTALAKQALADATRSPALTQAQWQRLMRHLQSNGNPLLVAWPTSAAVSDPAGSAPGSPSGAA